MEVWPGGTPEQATLLGVRDGKRFRFRRDGKIEVVSDLRMSESVPPTETYAYARIFGIANPVVLPSEQALIRSIAVAML